MFTITGSAERWLVAQRALYGQLRLSRNVEIVDRVRMGGIKWRQARAGQDGSDLFVQMQQVPILTTLFAS